MRTVLTGMSHNPSVTQLLYVTQEPGGSFSRSVFRFLKTRSNKGIVWKAFRCGRVLVNKMFTWLGKF